MRKKMPNRRPAATWNIEFEQQQLTGTIGYDPETAYRAKRFLALGPRRGRFWAACYMIRASYCRWPFSTAPQQLRWLNPSPVSKTVIQPAQWEN